MLPLTLATRRVCYIAHFEKPLSTPDESLGTVRGLFEMARPRGIKPPFFGRQPSVLSLDDDLVENGWGNRTRTCNVLADWMGNGHLLCQLSHTPVEN